MAIQISLATGSASEMATRDQLLALLRQYDLGKWQFTDRLRIQDGVISHSHPMLTLSTSHLDDALLLSLYIHEQLHWFAVRRPDTVASAIAELRQRYPVVPVGFPEGCANEMSSYLHLVICYLEYAALIELLGPVEARRVMDVWCQHHHTQIYATVIRDYDSIGDVVRRHGLIPQGPDPSTVVLAQPHSPFSDTL